MIATTDDIRELLTKYPNTLLVVDCFAKWCGPCKRIAPQVERLEEEFNNQILVRTVDVDESDDFSEMMKVEAMPTFIFFKHMKEIDRVVGADMNSVVRMIKTYL